MRFFAVALTNRAVWTTRIIKGKERVTVMVDFSPIWSMLLRRNVVPKNRTATMANHISPKVSARLTESFFSWETKVAIAARLSDIRTPAAT